MPFLTTAPDARRRLETPTLDSNDAVGLRSRVLEARTRAGVAALKVDDKVDLSRGAAFPLS
jgi:hypothetical protein